jgi:hypothetical protein
MRQIYIIIIFSLWLPQSSLLFGQTPFKNSVYNYQLTIPSGWQVIPQKEVVEFASRIQSEQGYNEGFYPVKQRASGWGYPYILTNFMRHKLSPDKFEEFANNFIRSSQLIQIKNNVSEKYSDQITQLNYGEAYYDKVNKRLVVKAQGNITGVGPIVAITTAFFGESGVFFLNYYETKSNYAKSITFHNLFVSSVKVD